MIRDLDHLENAITRIYHEHRVHVSRLTDSIDQDIAALRTIVEKSSSIYFPERSEVVRVLQEIESAREWSQREDVYALEPLVDISHAQLQTAGELYEIAQRKILYTDILSLKHQILFYGEVYRSAPDAEWTFDKKGLQKKFKQVFSRTDLTEKSLPELRSSYDRAKSEITLHDAEVALLRKNAQEQRKEWIEIEAQKWTDAATSPLEPPLPTLFKQIFISTEGQMAYAYEDGDLILSTPITSGRNAYSTIRGTFHIYDKERSKLMKSPFPNEPYELWVDYWLPFSGAYGIHDSCNSRDCWRTKFWPDQNYKGNWSHGCVNTPYKAVKFLYNWADIGTTVVVR